MIIESISLLFTRNNIDKLWIWKCLVLEYPFKVWECLRILCREANSVGKYGQKMPPVYFLCLNWFIYALLGSLWSRQSQNGGVSHVPGSTLNLHKAKMAAKNVWSLISPLTEIIFEWFQVWYWGYRALGVCWNTLQLHCQIILMIKIQSCCQITKCHENFAAIDLNQFHFGVISARKLTSNFMCS